MTWARLDDSFPQHPKVVGLSDQAFRLHVSAICYSCQKLSDGVIQARVLPLLLPGASRAAVRRRTLELTDAGVWGKLDGGDYEIHDFLEYNPPRAQVLANRDELSKKRSEAGRIGGRRRAERLANAKQTASNSEATGQANGKQNSSPVPDPVTPSNYDDHRARAHTRGDGGPLDLAMTAVENLTGSLTKYVTDELIEAVDANTPPEWFELACREAATQNVRTWAYVRGILGHWREHGRECECKRPKGKAWPAGAADDDVVAREIAASKAEAAARRRSG